MTSIKIDPILDAIDWDTPTGLLTEDRDYLSAADQNPALYEFITAAAELIPNAGQWRRFTKAFHRYEMIRGRP
jgi:hypothetical protein